MNRSLISCLVLGLALLTSRFAVPAPALQHPSPDFSINEPGGKTLALSSFKGKVVVLAFLFVKSQHCQRVAQTLNSLQAELGSRGLQSIAIVFDAPNPVTTGGDMLGWMADTLKLAYPVGYATRGEVDSYFGRSGNEMLSIPQLVVIDRAGTIRTTTGGSPNPSLEDINLLRMFVDGLLKESGPTSASAKR